MSDTLFKPPQEVLREIFSFNSGLKIKLNKAAFWVIISFVIVFVCIFSLIFKSDLVKILSTLGSALYLNNSEKIQLLIDCIKTNIGIILGPTLLIIILFYATRDPQALTGNTSSYIIFIGTIVMVCFGVFSSLPDFSDTPYMPFLIGGIVMLLVTFSTYFSSYITPSVVTAVSNVMRVIFVLMILVGLAIGYKMFSERLKSLTGWPGFFSNFLFYIPCMLSDGLEYLLQQYHITPNIVFVLLILELLLVLGYFFIPKIITKLIQKTSISLQNKPAYLDKEKNVGNVKNFLFKPFDSKIDYIEMDDVYRRNYCINMWVYLNIQPSSNSAYLHETTIFNYNNHPRITHKNKSDNERLKNGNVYTFYFSNTRDGNTIDDAKNTAKHEITVPDQKWNLISFNYFESKVDLYINGNLERTFYFANNIPDYSSNESVLLGSDGGVSGAICNVTYNKLPLSSEQIATLYNTNYLKNPPIDYIE